MTDIESFHSNHENWSSFLKVYRKLSIFQLNVRGINKPGEFLKIKNSIEMLNRPPTIIVLSEVKLMETKDLIKYQLENYKLESCLCDTSMSGLLVYVRKSLKHELVCNLSTSVQKIVVKFELNDNTFNLICFYRPPVNNFGEFFESLSKSLDDCTSHIILVGDININALSTSTNEEHKYKNILESYQCKVVNKHVTRLLSGTLLDHFVCNFKTIFPIQIHTIKSSLETDTELSDHSIVFAVVEVNNTNSNYITNVRRIIVDYPKLSEAFKLKVADIENLDSNGMADKFSRATMDAVERCKRTVTKRMLNADMLPPWIDGELLEKLDEENWNEELKEKPEKCEKLKDEYFQRMFKDDNKKAMQALSELANDQIILSGTPSPDDFNNFFTTKSKVKSIKIEPKEITYIYLYHANNEEIEDAIESLNPNDPPGHDEINLITVKHLKYKLIPLLKVLLNEIFSTGVYPDEYKKAVVTAVHEHGDPSLESSYRPLSSLSIFNNIIEQVICRRILKFYKIKDEIIQKEDEWMMTNIVDELNTHLNERKKVIGIFIDLRVTFDAMNHENLLAILSKRGINGKAYELIKSYLTNRKQRVRVKNKFSDEKQINFGCVNGSILGELLFNFVIDELKDFDFCGYDVVFLINFERHWDIREATTKKLSKIKETFDSLGLALKAVFIPFHSKSHHRINTPLGLKIDDETTIERVNEVYCSGLHLDTTLKFAEHLSMLENKLINIVKNLRKVKRENELTSGEMENIYDTLIVPLLSYHIASWGSSYELAMKRLEYLQIQALDVAFNVNQYEESEKFKISKRLPIKGLYLLDMAIIVHENNEKLSDSMPVSSWQNNHGKKCQTYIGHRFYNCLPNYVKNCDNFEDKCKQFIMRDEILKKTFEEKVLDVEFESQNTILQRVAKFLFKNF